MLTKAYKKISISKWSLCLLFLIVSFFLVKEEKVHAENLYYQNNDNSYILFCETGSTQQNCLTMGGIAPETTGRLEVGNTTINYPFEINTGAVTQIKAKIEGSYCSSGYLTIRFATTTTLSGNDYQQANFTTYQNQPLFVNDGQYHLYTIPFQNTQGWPNNFNPGDYKVYLSADNCSSGKIYLKSANSNADIFGIVTDTTGGNIESYTTRIDSFSYSTTTRIANITGYWNASDTPYISEKLSFWQYSNQLGKESFVELTATTSGAFNFSFEFVGLPNPYTAGTTTAPIILPYTLNAEINQYDENYYDPFGQLGLDQSKRITKLAATSTTVSTLSGYDSFDYGTTRALTEYPEYECSISSLTGCLKNAGIWLFYPSEQAESQFQELPEKIKTKFPFAYAYGMNDLRQELFNSSSTASTSLAFTFKIIPNAGTSTLTILSTQKLQAVPFANWIKTILGYLLWIMAAEFIYYKVTRIHDNDTAK